MNALFDIYGLEGSLYGGTEIWIKGYGFDEKDFDNKIMVGDIPCNINNYYTTSIRL